MASQMAVLLQKIDHLEELSHTTNTRVAVIETKVGTILESLIPMKKDIDDAKSFNSSLKGKFAVVAVLISSAVAFLFSWLGKKL